MAKELDPKKSLPEQSDLNAQITKPKARIEIYLRHFPICRGCNKGFAPTDRLYFMQREECATYECKSGNRCEFVSRVQVDLYHAECIDKVSQKQSKLPKEIAPDSKEPS